MLRSTLTALASIFRAVAGTITEALEPVLTPILKSGRWVVTRSWRVVRRAPLAAGALAVDAVTLPLRVAAGVAQADPVKVAERDVAAARDEEADLDRDIRARLNFDARQRLRAWEEEVRASKPDLDALYGATARCQHAIARWDAAKRIERETGFTEDGINVAALDLDSYNRPKAIAI